MTIPLLAVRTGEETDSALYPVVGLGRRAIALEIGDGDPEPTAAKSLTLVDQSYGRHKPLVGLREVPIELVLTDARLAFACDSFENGSGWVGWAPGAVASAAAGTDDLDPPGLRRRRRRVLVGQVRHPWVRAAGFRPRAAWFAAEQLRVAVTAPHARGERDLLLDLELPKGVSAEALCRSLVSRVAAHRLEWTACDPAEREALEALIEPPRVQPRGRHSFAVHHFPRYYVVSAHRVDRVGRSGRPVLSVAPKDNVHRAAVEPA
jgi:hypothetical protein